MSVHVVDEQRCHWYVKLVGSFDHVPVETVSVLPTFAVPLTFGGVVLTGTDAVALDATNNPETSVANSGASSFFNMRCLLLPFGYAPRLPGRNSAQYPFYRPLA